MKVSVYREAVLPEFKLGVSTLLLFSAGNIYAQSPLPLRENFIIRYGDKKGVTILRRRDFTKIKYGSKFR
ncbi:MAG: hypothetical protein ABI683_08675 [Ginsengibacter sp.]